MFANYKYSLTGQQQSDIQVWLRLLPERFKGPEWELLHELSYAQRWTKEPEYQLQPGIPK